MDEWNALVPQASHLPGVRRWTGIPSTIAQGEERLAWLRARLNGGAATPAPAPLRMADRDTPQAARLRAVYEEWNSLVPQAAGLSRVRVWTQVPADIARGEARLNWLKTQLRYRSSTLGLDFGVEMESLLPSGTYRENLRDRLREAGLAAEVEMLNHTTRTWWKLTTDGSLGDYVRGVETVSPILNGDDGFAALRTTCRTLTAMRATVTKICGLHVHVGVRDRDVEFFKRLIKLYATFEPVIDRFMAKSRRANNSRWARSIRQFHDSQTLAAATTLDELGQVYGRDTHHRSHHRQYKYRKLNLDNVWERGTVEFRQHQGSVDALKVEMWTRLCLKMVIAAAKPDLVLGPVTLDGFMTTIDASDAERVYYAARTAAFAMRALDQTNR
jgi:hypothetical protein